MFTQKELSDVGVDMVLYPLTAFRAMSLSAEKIYNSIIKDGTQEPLLDIMQTREELYEVLDYYNFEKQLDEQFENNNEWEYFCDNHKEYECEEVSCEQYYANI